MSGIEIKKISKSFGDVQALKDVSVVFEENKIYGLLGRNGAGKSTLLNVITSRIFADSGEVTVDGITAADNDLALQKIYMMSEKNYYPDTMKIKDAFKWTKEFYPDFDAAYAKTLADRFELNLNKRIKSLSTGYSSIFKIVTALSTNVPYILLDEPVLGLDANHRDLFYKIVIEKYSANPCTIIISTHLIEEAAGVIEQVVVIKDGSIIRDEPREELLSKGYTVSGVATAVDAFLSGKNVIGADTLGGLKTAYVLGTIDRTKVSAGLEISKMDLQRMFIQLTNT